MKETVQTKEYNNNLSTKNKIEFVFANNHSVPISKLLLLIGESDFIFLTKSFQLVIQLLFQNIKVFFHMFMERQ